MLPAAWRSRFLRNALWKKFELYLGKLQGDPWRFIDGDLLFFEKRGFSGELSRNNTFFLRELPQSIHESHQSVVEAEHAESQDQGFPPQQNLGGKPIAGRFRW